MGVRESSNVVENKASPRLLPIARDEKDVTSKAGGGVLFDTYRNLLPNGGGEPLVKDMVLWAWAEEPVVHLLAKELANCQLG